MVQTKKVSASESAKRIMVRTNCLKFGEPLHSLVGRTFCFEQDDHLIIGSIVSLGVEPSGDVSFRVDSPRFCGRSIIRILPNGPNEAFLEAEDDTEYEDGKKKKYTHKGTLTVYPR